MNETEPKMNQIDTNLAIEGIISNFYQTFVIKNYIVMVLYIPIILVAITANLTVIIIVFKNKYMRKISNYFLVNLAIADLLVTLICMPNSLWRSYTLIYNFGRYTCKIIAYIQCISVGTSIFTITAMSMHRYFAITQPLFGLMYRSINRCGTAFIVISLWFSSLFIFSPALWIYDVRVQEIPFVDNSTINFCSEKWEDVAISRQVIGVVWFTFVFAIPGLIMLIAYSKMGKTLCSDKPLFDDDSSHQRRKILKGRKRVACILLLLALVFAICWLPHHIFNLMDDMDSLDSDKKLEINQYLLLLGHLNSALNPVIYCALSKKFRDSIKKMFSRKRCKGQKELTRFTLIKLNTIRNQNLNHSNSPSETSGTIQGKNVENSRLSG